MLLESACSCLCATYWSQVLSGEWRCSWSSADRRCSNYIWLINNLIAYKGATYIRDLTVYDFTEARRKCLQKNFKWIFLIKNVYSLFQIPSLLLWVQYNKTALVYIMACCWRASKPLPKPIMSYFNKAYIYIYICITSPQCTNVKSC